MVEFIAQFFQRYGGSGKRSTALQPLIWIALVATGGLLTAIYLVAAYTASTEILLLVKWPVAILSGVMGLCMVAVVFITAYSICAGKTDLLRSEHYFLQKYEIERGDKNTGTTEPEGPNQMSSEKKD